MSNKSQLITPFLMLTAGMIASVIMYVRNFDLYRMLWNLLIVLIIFYVIGDIARYIYSVLRPRTIPAESIDQDMLSTFIKADYAESADDDAADEDEKFSRDFGEDGLMSEKSDEYYDEDGYSDEDIDGYDTDGETDDEY